jgi:pyrimidine operon attenuation protein/uracil phosphoribosyltransferase
MDKLTEIKKYCEKIISDAEENPADLDGDIFLVGIEEGEVCLAEQIIMIIENNGIHTIR